MALDKLVAVRFEPETVARLDQAAARLTADLRHRTTVSDVVRLAVEDYLRRNP